MSDLSNPIGLYPVPSGWLWKYFEQICSWSKYGITATSQDGGKYPMLRMNNLQNGQIDLLDLVYIDLPVNEFRDHKLHVNELLINRTNSYELVGKTALVKEKGDFVCASYIVRFGLDKAQSNPDYVNYFFNSSFGQRQLRTLATKGVSQANINPTVLKTRFEIPLPPLAEQRKIAAILGTWDEAIATAEKLIAKLRERRRGLMQRLLTGRARFKECVRSDETQVTDFGIIPGDWGYVSIGNIAQQVSLKNSKGLALPVLSCTKYDGLVDSLEYFGRQIFSDDTSTYKVVRRNQFAYATNHIEEGSIGYQNLHDAALISPMYTVFEADASVDDRFLYAVLKTETYRRIFERSMSATVDRRGSLRWPEFSRIRVPLPSIPEQQRIVSVLKMSDTEIAQHERRLELQRQQKRGLMQRLLSGQVRVQVEEDENRMQLQG